MTIKVLIVDDEPPARANLVHLLREQKESFDIREAGNGIEAAQLMGTYQPQLLFLDIQMPQLDGLELLKFLPAKKRPLTVFVTAHRDFAVDAFDLEAVDYLLKPFRRERFAQAMARVMERLGQERPPSSPQSGESVADGRLRLKDGKRHIFVTIENIEYVSAAGNYVEMHTTAGKQLLRVTLKNMQRLLPADQFVRIHRSLLVNRKCVSQITATENGDYLVRLQNGARLGMSRRRKHALRQLLGQDC